MESVPHHKLYETSTMTRTALSNTRNELTESTALLNSLNSAPSWNACKDASAIDQLEKKVEAQTALVAKLNNRATVFEAQIAEQDEQQRICAIGSINNEIKNQAEAISIATDRLEKKLNELLDDIAQVESQVSQCANLIDQAAALSASEIVCESLLSAIPRIDSPAYGVANFSNTTRQLNIKIESLHKRASGVRVSAAYTRRIAEQEA